MFVVCPTEEGPEGTVAAGRAAVRGGAEGHDTPSPGRATEDGPAAEQHPQVNSALKISGKILGPILAHCKVVWVKVPVFRMI